MIINDNILTLMIAKDMLSKNVENYQIKDEVVTNSEKIKVGANEVVYVCYCSVESPTDFSLQITSGTDVVNYHSKNTIKQELTAGVVYHSSQITSHWSSIKIHAKQTGDYYIRYIRITIQKKQHHEKS